LWISLADYHIRCGLFDKARDMLEEGVMSVVTVRDFSIVFDAYTHFEENVLAAKLEQSNYDEEVGEADEEFAVEVDPSNPNLS
jgi:pre-mRNA-splicing factor SYF1